MKILLVDDEQIAVASVQRLLKRRGIPVVETCTDGREAIERIREADFDIVLLDILMPEIGGLQVLEATKPYKPGTEFIVVSAVDDVPTSVRAVRLGAYDYLTKPVDPERLVLSIQRAYERKGLRAGQAGSMSVKKDARVPEAFAAILTRNPRMIELIHHADIVARSGMPVMITGESGTGKELFARAIHLSGRGKDRPFIPVNVTAVPEHLFESHFFGHAAGAFTGATGAHKGYFQQADGGTLYMDEIGDLPLQLQVKFLRILEENTVTRVGESRPRAIDVRIVSSTNADLDARCRSGSFRLDLYYRLNAGTLHIPALRERLDDVPLLATHFLEKANARFGKEIQGFSREAGESLVRRAYPGNVRELIHLVDNAALRCGERLIGPEHLGDTGGGPRPPAGRLCTLRENADAHVAYIFRQTGGDPKKMADILGISVRQVQRRLADMKASPRWTAELEKE